MVIGAGGAPGAASGRAAGITTGAGTGDANWWECLGLMGAGAATSCGTGNVDGEVLGSVILMVSKFCERLWRTLAFIFRLHGVSLGLEVSGTDGSLRNNK